MCSDALASRTSVRHTAIVTRTRVRWARVLALLATTLLVLGLAGRALGGSSRPDEDLPRPHVLIETGDTLWSIARARVGPEADPRPYIQRILELNNLPTASLEQGQLLLLPAA